MAVVRGIGFAGKSAHRTGRRLLLGLTGVLALALLAQAQDAPAPPRNSPGKDRGPVSAVKSPAAPAGVPAATDPVPAADPAPEPVPQTAEQVPPQPPVVTLDGNLLTIDADNSTLTAILLAVRTRTGAAMEIPAAASAQRVFAHFGPGPVRDVLSSLLYGTGFDYIVETAEDNPNELRSVVLTAEGKGDDSVAGSLAGNGVASSASSSAVGANVAGGAAAQAAAHRQAGMRLMPGWAGPGKPAFQADAEAALAAKEAASQESAPASDSADGTAQNPASAGSESAATGQGANSNGAQSSAAAAPSSTGAGSGTEAELSSATTAQADAASAPASGSDDPTGVSHMIQNMTHMFEQRRQIQAQQNQPSPEHQPNAN